MTIPVSSLNWATQIPIAAFPVFRMKRDSTCCTHWNAEWAHPPLRTFFKPTLPTLLTRLSLPMDFGSFLQHTSKEMRQLLISIGMLGIINLACLRRRPTLTPRMPKQIHVVSHGPHCLDGVAAAVAVARYHAGQGEVIARFAANSEIDRVLQSFDPPPGPETELWITDISWREPATDVHLSRLAARGVRIFWVDHHRSALERLPIRCSVREACLSGLAFTKNPLSSPTGRWRRGRTPGHLMIPKGRWPVEINPRSRGYAHKPSSCARHLWSWTVGPLTGCHARRARGTSRPYRSPDCRSYGSGYTSARTPGCCQGRGAMPTSKR